VRLSTARSQSLDVAAFQRESSSGNATFMSVIGIKGMTSLTRLSSRSATTQEYANLKSKSVQCQAAASRRSRLAMFVHGIYEYVPLAALRSLPSLPGGIRVRTTLGQRHCMTLVV
jgi:hypothetical protein